MNGDNVLFEIKQEVLDSLKNYVQNDGNELCGVLTGVKISKKCYRISKVSPPCVKKHSRCGCERDATLANNYIREDFERSERTRFYIGEWHTHPESVPSPSLIDKNSIIDIYNTALLVAPFLFMIIVGRERFYITAYDGEKFVKVEPRLV